MRSGVFSIKRFVFFSRRFFFLQWVLLCFFAFFSDGFVFFANCFVCFLQRFVLQFFLARVDFYLHGCCFFCKVFFLQSFFCNVVFFRSGSDLASIGFSEVRSGLDRVQMGSDRVQMGLHKI